MLRKSLAGNCTRVSGNTGAAGKSGGEASGAPSWRYGLRGHVYVTMTSIQNWKWAPAGDSAGVLGVCFAGPAKQQRPHLELHSLR